MFNRLLFFKEAQITPQLIESVAVVHFARSAQKSYPYANANEVAFYWMGKKETDIVLKDENKLLGVEVKYKNRISKQDFASLYHFKEGIIASRSTFNPGDTYSIIPVHILLGII
jgi:predicted AAA+ superfamily ATPase